MSLAPEEFDACFDRFQTDVFRLETLQRYDVAEEAERFAAWRDGRPRPDRSVRTSPWLRRIAVTTAAGKRWRRLHVVEQPLSEYVRYELVGYVESAAAGEEIHIAERAEHPDLSGLTRDFWLFDSERVDAFAVLMRYHQDGHWLGADLSNDAETLQLCRHQRDLALQSALSLNAYLAVTRRAEHVV